MLLVAGEDLIAAAELETADHLCHTLGGAGGERDVGGLGAEHGRVGAAQRCGQLGAAFEVRHRAPARASSRSSSRAAACTARAGSGPSVPALRYATLESTGNCARNPDRLTNRENTRMASAARAASHVGAVDPSTASSVEMARFMSWAGARRGRAFADYDELWRWSVDELEDFWASVWEFCGVRASAPYERACSALARCPARAGSRAPS